MATVINRLIYSSSQTVKAYNYGNLDAYVFSLEVIENSYDIATNKSNVTINEYAYGINGFWYYDYSSIPLIINTYDDKTDTTIQRANSNIDNIPKNTKTLIGTWTGDIEHKTDGSLNLTVTTSYSHSYSDGYLPPRSVTFNTGSLALTTIPRASSVACTNFVVKSGNNATITIGRASDSFTHTISYSFGNLSGTIATKTSDTSLVWAYSVSDFLNQMSNTNSKTGTITCQTYNRTTLIGTSTCNFVATVTDGSTINSATVYDTNSTTRALTSATSHVIKYASTPRITISATANTGTSISTYRLVCGDIDITQSSNVFNLSNVTTSSYIVYVTDARGNTTSKSFSLTLKDYIKLDFINTETNFKRLSPTSNTVKITAKGYYFSGSFGNTTNTLTMKYRYREKGSSTWSSYVTISSSNITISNGEFSISTNISGTFSYLSSFEFELVIIDKVYTSGITLSGTSNMTVLTGERLMTKYKDRVDFKAITIGSQTVLTYDVIDTW